MITISELNFSYDDGSKIFSHENLSIERGHVYGLLGKNGSGKSTLLYLLSGLLFPTHGTIDVDGREPKDRQVELLRDIYFVADADIFDKIKLSQHVQIYAPFYPHFSHEVLDYCLTAFGITGNPVLTKLSLGQKRKVAISFALATGTPYLLMDEPTNGLDIPSKAIFRQLMARYMTDERTFIISTHQVLDVENLFDSLIILRDGDRMFMASTAEVTERYAFEVRPSGSVDGDVLYAEPSPEGEKCIVKNTQGRETELDMELLFNAVTNGKIG